ncbi:hypothetical protein ACMFMF_003726 [Clarireedia jacksonii]
MSGIHTIADNDSVALLLDTLEEMYLSRIYLFILWAIDVSSFIYPHDTNSLYIMDNQTAPPFNSSKAFDRRQNLLEQIYKFNSHVNTPLDLKIHITGLTIEEGSILERGHVSEWDRITPPFTLEEATNIQNITQSTLGEESADNRQLLIRLRNLQRENETLEMEGRSRTAKEQANRCHEERCRTDQVENKILSSDTGFEKVPLELPSAGNGKNAEIVLKPNREWIDREDDRRMVTEEDDSEMLEDRLPPQTSPVSPMLPPHSTTQLRSIYNQDEEPAEKASQVHSKVQPKVEPLRNKWPRPSVKDTPLLPGETPVQWKLRIRRIELAREKYEKTAENQKSHTESASQIKDEAKHKTKHCKVEAQVDNRDSTQQATNLQDTRRKLAVEEVNGRPREKSPPLNDREVEAKQLRELEKKRQKREGRYKCYTTISKIERENVAAYNRAQALAQEVQAEGPGQSGSGAEKAERAITESDIDELEL